jgi:hypothetical protein
MARPARRQARAGRRAIDVHVIPACRAARHISAAKVEAPPPSRRSPRPAPARSSVDVGRDGAAGRHGRAGGCAGTAGPCRRSPRAAESCRRRSARRDTSRPTGHRRFLPHRGLALCGAATQLQDRSTGGPRSADHVRGRGGCCRRPSRPAHPTRCPGRRTDVEAANLARLAVSCRARPRQSSGAFRPAAGPRRAGVRRLVPGRLGTGRHGGTCGRTAARVCGRRPDCDHQRCMRVHAAQAAIRRRWRDSAGSGFGFGLCCARSSIGLMAMLVALGVMSTPG